jgi:hypothetical protein
MAFDVNASTIFPFMSLYTWLHLSSSGSLEQHFPAFIGHMIR